MKNLKILFLQTILLAFNCFFQIRDLINNLLGLDWVRLFSSMIIYLEFMQKALTTKLDFQITFIRNPLQSEQNRYFLPYLSALLLSRLNPAILLTSLDFVYFSNIWKALHIIQTQISQESFIKQSSCQETIWLNERIILIK